MADLAIFEHWTENRKKHCLQLKIAFLRTAVEIINKVCRKKTKITDQNFGGFLDEKAYRRIKFPAELQKLSIFAQVYEK